MKKSTKATAYFDIALFGESSNSKVKLFNCLVRFSMSRYLWFAVDKYTIPAQLDSDYGNMNASVNQDIPLFTSPRSLILACIIQPTSHIRTDSGVARSARVAESGMWLQQHAS